MVVDMVVGDVSCYHVQDTMSDAVSVLSQEYGGCVHQAHHVHTEHAFLCFGWHVLFLVTLVIGVLTTIPSIPLVLKY